MRLWQRIVVSLVTTAVLVIALLVYLGNESDNLTVSLEMPDTVVVGESFDVTLNIKNLSDSPQTIISIGVAESLQDQGLVIEDTLPDYRTVDKRSIWSEYTFAITRRPVIEPNDSIPLRITMVAQHEGPVKGELAVWLENDLQATSIEIQLEAVEE